MSFDMFVIMIRDGDAFDRAIVERAFAPLVRAAEDGDWDFGEKGELSGVTMLVGDEERIDGFSFNRPPRYEDFPEFWEALFDVLRLTPTVLVWPDDEPPISCIGNSAHLDLLPEEFLAHFGTPAIASSGGEIDAIIASKKA